MEAPLISIITPTYNRAQTIQRTINSVVSQTYRNWEHIIVDDGSTDDTIEVLDDFSKKDTRIHYYLRKRLPKGGATCRNIGLKHASGDYVLFFDSDDYLLEFCLEQRVKAINEFPNFDFLVFPMGELKGKKIIKKEIPLSDNYLVPFLSADLPWSIMCPIWKRDVLLNLNGFTEGYIRFNDPELMIRALLLPNISFEVFSNHHFDTVYLPSKKPQSVFIKKVYKSLHLIIPDISRHLDNSNKAGYKVYLVYYLHLWFKYFYIPFGKTNIWPSLKLIRMFRRYRIISNKKVLSIITRLLVYSLSKSIFKTPIDKLSGKAIYMSNKPMP